MKLIFNYQYKSISQFEDFNLPEFTILTGLNGAGKSHLLDAIVSNAVSIEGVPPNQINGTQYIRKFDSSSLAPQDTGEFSSGQISSEQTGYWNEIAQLGRDLQVSFRQNVRSLNLPFLDNKSIKEIESISVEDLIAADVLESQAVAAVEIIGQWIAGSANHIKAMFIRNDLQIELDL